MNALFIDDNSDSIAPAMDVFRTHHIDCKNIPFEKFESTDPNATPDVVILDMMNGGTAADPYGNGGKRIFENIWKHSFCPIIIYSADPELSNAPQHPFIRKQKKGKGSEDELLSSVNSFMPYLSAKNSLSSNIGTILSETLRDTATAIFSNSDCAIEPILIRLTRRRIAAAMDLGYDNETKLQPYEQYIYPVLGEDWQQGDIIQHKTENSFSLVLTPSCDLVVRKDGHIKTDSILCARCTNFSCGELKQFFAPTKKAKGCAQCSSCETNAEECKAARLKAIHESEADQFCKMLNSGFVGKFYLLPGLIGQFGDMLANLKDLYVIKEIEMNLYNRVASIDSPFKEKLNEAFFSNAGRLATPDRDFSALAKKYVEGSI